MVGKLKKLFRPELDWYNVRKYDLGVTRDNELITEFPDKGDTVLVLENENQQDDQTYIKFDSPNAPSFDLNKYRKLRHKFTQLYLTNTIASGKKLYLLFARGDWDIERKYPEEQIYTMNADTVDSLHASASREAEKLIALGSDGFFPDNCVRNLQHEIYANIPASPVAGDTFIATDTQSVYVCFTDGSWTQIYP